jgi:general secretion pathway protein G
MRPRPCDARRSERGVTYLEMIATAGILLIMASAILPMAQSSRRKMKEIELANALREIRSALDAYRGSCFNPGGVQSPIQPYDQMTINCQDGIYPKKLEILVEGVQRFPAAASAQAVDVGEKSVRFLRRIPKDPMTEDGEWGLRSRKDDPKSTSWYGDEVWDVYSKSNQMDLAKKRKYSEW